MTEPTNSGTTNTESQFDPNLWNQTNAQLQEQDRQQSSITGDLPNAYVGGLLKAGQAFKNIGDKLTSAIGVADEPADDASAAVDRSRLLKTTTGRIAQELTAFTAVNAPLAIAGGEALGTVGLTGKTAAAASFAVKDVLAPVVTQKALYGDHAAVLANLIESNPKLSNPITRFLAVGPDDSTATATLKQALDGTFLSVTSHFGLRWITSLAKGDEKGATEALQASERFRNLVGQVTDAAPQIKPQEVQDAFTPILGLARSARKSVEDWLADRPLKFVSADKEAAGALNQENALAGPRNYDAGNLLSKLEEAAGGGKKTKSVRRFVFNAEYTGEGLAKVLGTNTDAIPHLRAAGLIERTEQGTYKLNPDSFPGEVLNQQVEADAVGPKSAVPVVPPEGMSQAVREDYARRGVPLRPVSQDALPVEGVTPQPLELAGQPKTPSEAIPLEGGTPPPDPYEVKQDIIRKGWIKFAQDGSTVIGLFKSADVSTLNHELFHYVRRYGLSDGMQDSLATALGVSKAELGSTDVEEKAARLYERYLADGKAPNAELQPVFDRVKQAMSDIYKDVNASEIGNVVSPEVRAVFDQITAGDKVDLAGAAKEAASASTLDQVFSPDAVKRFSSDLRSSLKSGQSFSEAAYNARTHFNWNRINTVEDAKAVQAKLIEFLETEHGKLGSEPIKLVDAAKLARDIADDLSVDPDSLAKLTADAQASKGLATRLVAYRIFRNSLARQAGDLNKMVNDRPWDTAVSSRAASANSVLLRVMSEAKDIETNLARGPSFGRIIAGEAGDPLDSALQGLAKDLKGARGPAAQRAVRLTLQMAGDDAGTIKSVVKSMYGVANKALSVINEIHINALISSPKTVSKILMAEFMQAVALPGERVLGGILTGNADAIKDGGRIFLNHILGIADIFHVAGDVEGLTARPLSAAKKAFLVGDSILAPHESDFTGAISAGNLGLDPARNFGKAVNWIGGAVRFPQRTHQAIDELYRQLMFQSSVRSQAFSEAERIGLKSGSSEWGNFVSKYVQDSFGEGGIANNAEAMKLANAATFNQQLTGLSKRVQDAVNAHPALRLLIPFVKKPTNLFRTFGQYTPVIGPIFDTEFRNALLSSDPALRASAVGRLAVGSGFWALAVGAVASGRLTGGGPPNRVAKQRLMETGWQPYSFVSTLPDGSKSYTSYRSIEPINRILSIAADYHEIGNHLKDDDRDSVAAAMVGALAHGLTNETYITSIRQAAEAISSDSGPDAASRFADSFAGGFVPQIVSQANPDNYLRRVSGLIDTLKRRIPGMSDVLPPVRSLFGEPVPLTPGRQAWGTGTKLAMMANPLAYSHTAPDSVKNEIANLRFGFTPPPRKYQGIELSLFKNAQGQDAADRLAELVGHVQINGQHVHQAMEGLMNSQHYQSLPTPSTDNDTTNGRVMEVNRVMLRYREAAERQMLREYPDVQKAILAARRQAIQNRQPQTSPTMAVLSRLSK
jgi:hypothetical protein